MLQIVGGGVIGLAAGWWLLQRIQQQQPERDVVVVRQPVQQQRPEMTPQRPPSAVRRPVQRPEPEPSPPSAADAVPMPQSLPRVPTSRRAPPPKPAGGFADIELAPGVAFSAVLLELPDDWKALAFPAGGNIYYALYPNRELQGAFGFLDGLLHGAAGTWHLNGQLSGLAGYRNGQRDGRLFLWDEAGKPTYFCQSTRGRVDGFKCLFLDGGPRLVQHWDNGQLKAERLITFTDNGSMLAVAQDQLSESDKPAWEASHLKLVEIEDGIADNERTAKAGLASWYREMEEDLRQERVTDRAARISAAAAKKRLAARNAASKQFRGMLDRALSAGRR